ncbi:hypothetical protein V9T40_000072 [Parthenolecanium corni]|uniref:Peptidase C1A papain C-terminal domain-containing protein n=1 Tax=Parthenolecanium corni TaxID=536013 RepID=A0AAN9TUW3_9HEMI
MAWNRDAIPAAVAKCIDFSWQAEKLSVLKTLWHPNPGATKQKWVPQEHPIRKLGVTITLNKNIRKQHDQPINEPQTDIPIKTYRDMAVQTESTIETIDLTYEVENEPENEIEFSEISDEEMVYPTTRCADLLSPENALELVVPDVRVPGFYAQKAYFDAHCDVSYTRRIKLYVIASVSLENVVVQHTFCKKDRIINAQKLVRLINSDPNSMWKADAYGMKKLNIDRISRTHLGLKSDLENNFAQAELNTKGVPDGKPEEDNLPSSFSWTNPKNTRCPISHIRYQGNCGSCWAVSAAAAFGDRICIQSNSKRMVNISANYITACNDQNHGCNGGYMEFVYEFLKSGVITGGDYESDEGCQPYEIKPCTRQIYMPCDYSTAITPKCRKRVCTNDWYGSKKETETNTFYAKSWKLIVGNALTASEYYIRKDVYENGPLTISFLIYEDFLFYKSGIYNPRQDQELLSGHAARLIGWGEENGIKYWQIANSWGTTWGENGFFRMIRGINACRCESRAFSVMPDLK